MRTPQIVGLTVAPPAPGAGAARTHSVPEALS
jgi:hypothetical protein